MKKLKQGILISVEGIDGSGKSTLALNLNQKLREQYASVTLTKEPGDSKLGLQLRTLLQEKPVPVCAKAEYLLFAADRAQHMVETVEPALEKKSIVISDRMADSSLVYQGFGRGLSVTVLDTINRWAMNDRPPDLTLYVTIPIDLALDRIQKRNKPLTSFEQDMQTSFTQKLLTGFDTIFSARDNVITLDGTKTPEQLTSDALKAVEQWLLDKNISA